MAKSLRSKWRRKMRAEKRKKIEVKVVARLKQAIAMPYIPTLTEIAAQERQKTALAAALSTPSDEMEANADNSTAKIRPWMNQRRVKRMADAAKRRGITSAAAKLTSSKPKDQPRIKVAMKKRHKGKQRKLNNRLRKVNAFPVA